MSRGKRIADMCISEKCTHTEPNQEFKVTVVDKLPHQILETGEPGDDSSESDIEEKTHFNEPIQVADNFTGECSYRDLGSDVEEQTDYEGSSDDFVPCSDSDSDTSFNSKAQNQFIANLIDEQNEKIERKKTDGKESRRKYSRKYHLLKNASRIEVCQIMFLNTFDLTLKKVRVITEKNILSESGICAEDRRGKHSNHPKVPDKDREEIRRHIKMFPSYESHYSRSHTKKQYLSPDLSISKMYRLYVTYCLEKNITPRNEALYRKIFVEEFNLSFHNPANDTCGTCDKYNLLLKSASNDEEKESLALKKNEHLQLADAAYQEKRDDKLRCKTNSKMVVVSFDLQKCLPTPHLTTGISFYKRKLWTLNLTLYETRENKNSAICYLWNETIAKRGGQEIASCLFSYLKNALPQDVNEIIFFAIAALDKQETSTYLMFMTILEEFKNSGREVTINPNF
ncbi:hypothetical protein JTB14_036118 [Gonioctena quinquepunctata]|nr:hypothetical protein JTB14_036118 [Gonioctena quinquepunctata]